MLGIGAGYQPYEFERFGTDIAQNLEMTEEFCDILDLAFSREFFSYQGRHYRIPETHIPARPVQNPLPIYVAGPYSGDVPDRRAAWLSGALVGPGGRRQLLADQYADIVAAFAAENKPLSRAHITINRFAHITDSREEGMRFAENARYQTRLASSLRRRQEVMQGTVLVDVPSPTSRRSRPSTTNLLIGDVDTVAEKLVAEIDATSPCTCASRSRSATRRTRPAMRSMELMIGEVKPKVEKALSSGRR
jgi:alkanesulfonate monooxygenase SsuD/methylene tetrahydromethanopterin reductase-like flavin-dependent oxidoreductase (luciferase family)